MMHCPFCHWDYSSRFLHSCFKHAPNTAECITCTPTQGSELDRAIEKTRIDMFEHIGKMPHQRDVELVKMTLIILKENLLK